MKIGSLFSGIGGLELGLEAGIPGAHTVWQAESDSFCRTVLARHWPDAERFADVRDIGASNYQPDLLCGGFPCQDLSQANRWGRGLAGERSELWGEFTRVIEAVEYPRWIVIENVGPAWRRWVPFVRRDLWGLGYASLPLWLHSSEIGAPHDRRRVFVLAHARTEVLSVVRHWWTAPDADCNGKSPCAVDAEVAGVPAASGLHQQDWRQPPPRALGVVDGLPAGLVSARLSAIGNAVMPQQSEVIGRLIARAEAQ